MGSNWETIKQSAGDDLWNELQASAFHFLVHWMLCHRFEMWQEVMQDSQARLNSLETYISWNLHDNENLHHDSIF